MENCRLKEVVIDLWQLEITKHVRSVTGVFLQLKNFLMRTGLVKMDYKATVGLADKRSKK